MVRKEEESVVLIPINIYNEILRQCKEHYQPFGSRMWEVHHEESDIDYLLNEKEWKEVKRKWFSSKQRLDLIKYDAQVFQSVKFKPDFDSNHPILNLIIVESEDDYNASKWATEQMFDFLDSPLIRKKVFRVRLFEMIKEVYYDKIQSKPMPIHQPDILIQNSYGGGYSTTATTMSVNFDTVPILSQSMAEVVSDMGVYGSDEDIDIDDEDIPF